MILKQTHSIMGLSAFSKISQTVYVEMNKKIDNYIGFEVLPKILKGQYRHDHWGMESESYYRCCCL